MFANQNAKKTDLGTLTLFHSLQTNFKAVGSGTSQINSSICEVTHALSDCAITESSTKRLASID